MYGLVNHAIQGLLTKEFGEDAWEEIKEKAGVEDDLFVSMKQYDDSITYNLVGAASEVTKLGAADLLEAFGVYWVMFTADHGYAEMMNTSGKSFVEFVENLNNLHVRVANIMPGLMPPKFGVEKTGERSMVLSYSSKRAGLNPMVIGLIKGLAQRFNEPDIAIAETSVVEGDEGFTSTFDVAW